MSVENCRIIGLPKISDTRGNLSVIEGNDTIPFKIERVFYMYDVVDNGTRGNHAHKTFEQFIIAMSGTFWVEINDGFKTQEFFMHGPHFGLYVCPKIWVKVFNFNVNSVCMVLTSDHYDEDDYIRDYKEFLDTVKR
jgi:hypothetical protein